MNHLNLKKFLWLENHNYHHLHIKLPSHAILLSRRSKLSTITNLGMFQTKYLFRYFLWFINYEFYVSNMTSSIYGRCGNPSRTSSSRKRRSIDDDRDIIKIRTTKTVQDPERKSSFEISTLSICAIVIFGLFWNW